MRGTAFGADDEADYSLQLDSIEAGKEWAGSEAFRSSSALAYCFEVHRLLTQPFFQLSGLQCYIVSDLS